MTSTFAVFTYSHNSIAKKDPQHRNYQHNIFRKAVAKSGILGRKNLKKGLRNPGGTGLGAECHRKCRKVGTTQ